MGTTATISTRDGLRLLVRRWVPEGKPWARALIVHGLSEHSGRYECIGGWFAAAGIDAVAYDQRGWGGSDGYRGDAERWTDLLDDLREAIEWSRAEPPAGLTLVLYAHSLGGLVATDYLTSGRPLPDLAVLSAPGIDSTHGRVLRLVASTAGRIAPRYRPPVVPDHSALLCHDPTVGRAFRTDPLAVHDPTARFGALGFAAQREVRARLDAMAAAGTPFPVPALVVHGAADGIVPVSATDRFERLPGVTRRVYPGLRHETHHEPEGEQIVAATIAWIRDRALPARAPVATLAS
jgi:alpha-beta hydrolase superfamily lysophospholipase